MSVEALIEAVYARGHPNVQATHRTTVEVTKDEDLTPRGDCIIGIGANKSTDDLSEEFKKVLKDSSSILVALLYVESTLSDIIVCHGSESLSLNDRGRIVFRKSGYIDPSTIGIKCSKAAIDLSRYLVNKLKNPETVLNMVLIALKFPKIYSKDILHWRVL
ncbi:MAG: DUF371 domain-containing protein [Sulfolobales archaeon]|nr:DUF371 domain-containing protein [Sulfolobales archaeon]MCX8198735.1 DUF371 domain-containing protein [Sulfolobales archaeon]MDW8169808.1 DUF371 domain-containing protein [Desulfurococcaceae archaeon]